MYAIELLCVAEASAMDDANIDEIKNSCVYCRSPFRIPKLKPGSQTFSITPPACPKCGLVQPYKLREPALSLHDEQKLLTDRIDILNRRLASLHGSLVRP
jgi:hypothetical protein